jgi:hypothetical protein
MSSTGLSGQIKNYKKLLKDLKSIEGSMEKALKTTLSDMRTRAPTQVAKAVTGRYNLKYKEVSRGKKGDSERHVGSLSVRGGTLESLQLKYSGKKLTPSPSRFSLKGGTNPIGGSGEGKKKKPTPLTMMVKKGGRETLPSDAFLAPSKYTPDRLIPFQRVGRGRGPLQSITTTSLPEMVEDTAEQYMPKISEVLEARLEHNVNRQLGTK